MYLASVPGLPRFNICGVHLINPNQCFGGCGGVRSGQVCYWLLGKKLTNLYNTFLRVPAWVSGWICGKKSHCLFSEFVDASLSTESSTETSAIRMFSV